MGSVRLWDVETRKKAAQFDGHAAKVADVAFSPDGKVASHCADDHRLRIFRLPDTPKDASTGGKKALFGP